MTVAISMLADLFEDYIMVSENLLGCLKIRKQIEDKGMESMVLARISLVKDLIRQEPDKLDDV